MTRRRQFERLEGQFLDLIEELWQVPRFAGMRVGFRPEVDCIRSEDPARITVVAELAGVDPKDVQVVVGERALLIAGERRRPHLSGRYQQMEIPYGPFERRLPLPEPVDPSHARADYKRGVLTIVLPVAEQPVRHERVQIPVAVGR